MFEHLPINEQLINMNLAGYYKIVRIFGKSSLWSDTISN